MSENTVKSEALAEALAKVKSEQAAITKSQDMGWMEALQDFDWKHVPPHQMAVVLTKKPFRGKAGTFYFLTPSQALFFAMRCFELGLSPLSSEVWFNPEGWTVNITTEGKRKMARLAGLDLGPPHYKRLERDWPKGKAQPGIERDLGYECTMSVGSKGDACYTAWLSEWMMPTTQWRDRPEHMLQVRAQEKCITFATGVGISEIPDERELEEVGEKPEIQVTDVEIKPLGEKQHDH